MSVIIGSGKFLLAAALGVALLGPASAQDAPLAKGYVTDGWAEASLASARRDGDKLLVVVRFKAAEGVEGVRTVFSSINQQSWDSDFYVVAGDKKYLLMKDAADQPLADGSLTLRAGTPQAGSWSGVFPAPPAGESATLYVKGVEPLGPFTVPQ